MSRFVATRREDNQAVTSCRFLDPGEEPGVGDLPISLGVFSRLVHLLDQGEPVALDSEGEIHLLSPPSAYHVWNPLTFEYEVSTSLLEQARAAKWEEIKEYRAYRTAGGIPVGPYWFHSDTPSKLQHLGLLNARMLSVLPAGQQWKLMDGTLVTLTNTLVEQIFGAAMQRESANFTKAEQHRALMNASSDPANYDFTTGWPPIFGE